MSTETAATPRIRQSGFSLVELVIAIVIVGIGLAALLVPIITATRSSADPLIRKQTLDGVAIPALANYNVTNVSVVGTALGAITAANAVLISVTVTGPGGDAITLAAYR